MRRFFTTTMALMAGTLLSRAIGLAMLPVYTHYLRPADLGEYDVWFNTLTFAAPLVFAQIWDAVYRHSFPPHNDSRAAVANGMAVMLVGLMAYSIVAWPTIALLEPRQPLLVFLQGPAIVAIYFFGFLARSRLRNTLFAISGIISAAVNASVTVALILLYGADISALYGGYLAGAALQVAILIYALRKDLLFDFAKISWHLIRSMLAFTLPLCATSIAYWALAGYTRIALAHLEGSSATGIFAVADRFSVLLTLLVVVFQMAWNEHLYITPTDSDQEARATPTRSLLVATLAAGTVLMTAATAVFDFLIGPEYQAARTLVPILMMGAALNGAANFLTGHFMTAGDTRPVLWSTTTGAVTNVFLSPILITQWGIEGAATSLALSFGVTLITRGIFVQRVHALPLISIGTVSQFFLILGATLLIVQDFPLWSSVTVATAALVAALLSFAKLRASIRETENVVGVRFANRR